MLTLRLPVGLRATVLVAPLALAAVSLGCSASQAEDRAPHGGTPLGVTPAVLTRLTGDSSRRLRDDAAAGDAYAGNRAQPPDGLYGAEVCNRTLGACEVADVEVRGGYIETIFLMEGRHLELDGAELMQDGSATGDAYGLYGLDEGYTGDVWSVRIRGRERARS